MKSQMATLETMAPEHRKYFPAPTKPSESSEARMWVNCRKADDSNEYAIKDFNENTDAFAELHPETRKITLGIGITAAIKGTRCGIVTGQQIAEAFPKVESELVTLREAKFATDS